MLKCHINKIQRLYETHQGVFHVYANGIILSILCHVERSCVAEDSSPKPIHHTRHSAHTHLSPYARNTLSKSLQRAIMQKRNGFSECAKKVFRLRKILSM